MFGIFCGVQEKTVADYKVNKPPAFHAVNVEKQTERKLDKRMKKNYGFK